MRHWTGWPVGGQGSAGRMFSSGSQEGTCTAGSHGDAGSSSQGTMVEQVAQGAMTVQVARGAM